MYFRSQLEYGSPVWLPHHSGKIIQIESVQRRFTKRLPSLYKILFGFGLVSDVCNELLIISSSTIPTRGHAFKLYQWYSRVDPRKQFSAERIAQPC